MVILMSKEADEMLGLISVMVALHIYLVNRNAIVITLVQGTIGSN